MHDRLITNDMQQTHPLYAIDRDQIDALFGHDGEPGPKLLTTIAALFSRHAAFHSADDIRDYMYKCLKPLGFSRDKLNLKTRDSLESGWRSGQDPVAEGVGSGSYVEDSETSCWAVCLFL